VVKYTFVHLNTQPRDARVRGSETEGGPMNAQKGKVAEEGGRANARDSEFARSQPTAGRSWACPGGCPVCSGPLVPLRGTYRCTRCCYSLCVGCEAPTPAPTAGPIGEAVG